MAWATPYLWGLSDWITAGAHWTSHFPLVGYTCDEVLPAACNAVKGDFYLTALADLHGLPWRFHAQPPCPDKTSRGLGPHTHQHLLLMPAISTHHTLFIAFPAVIKNGACHNPPSTGHKEHMKAVPQFEVTKDTGHHDGIARKTTWRMLGIPGDGRG